MSEHYLKVELYKRIKEDDEIFDWLQEGSLDGIWYWDMENPIEEWLSPKFKRVFGYDDHEMKNSSEWWQENIHPDDLEMWLEQFEAHKRGDIPFVEGVVRYTHKDGSTVWVNCRGLIIRDESGKPIRMLGAHTNLTELKKAEQELAWQNEELCKLTDVLEGRVQERSEELRKSEEQLRQIQKLDAIGQLAGGIAHDFNNVLTAIIGYTETALEDLEAGEPIQKGDLEEVLRSSNRAADLTQQLLAFSRQQMLEPIVLNLNSAVSDMDKMLRRIIGEDISFLTVLAPDLGNVRADAGQIEQIILNLIVNSRDAMPDGGKLTLETGNVDLDDEYCQHHVSAKPGPHVMIAVSDTGIGMDESTISRVFEPFFTTKEAGKGTGLGLATTYGIVKQSGGNIWIYSETGKGTTFKVYLPRVTGDADSIEPDVQTGDIPTGNETLLLVEDEEPVRMLAKRILEKKGYNVLIAGNSEDALELSKAHEGTIDLLLTDVVLPGMKGPDLAKKIQETYPDLEVLFMSGYTANGIVHQGELDAGTSFIQKPFTPKGLSQRIREILDGKTD